MRVWARIDNASGTLTGANWLWRINNLSVTRALDGAGRISFGVPGTDVNANNLLQEERRVAIYLHDGNVKRQLARGVIKKLGARSVGGSLWERTVECEDELTLLKNISTLFGRTFSATQIMGGGSSVVETLVGLVSGWSATGTVSDVITARFDGENVLKALQRIARDTGNHLRLNATSKQLEFGAFGSDSGITLMGAGRITRGLLANDSVGIITSMTLQSESGVLFNRIYPFMNSMGEAVAGLEYSDRSISGGYDYDRESVTGPNGQELYYIEDSASIAQYGLIEKFGFYREVAPLSNSAAALLIAGNSIYDSSAVQLTRYSQPQKTYRVSVKKVGTIQPGDVIHIHYRGAIMNRAGELVDFRNINDDFWVLSVTERFGADGITTELEVSNIDARQKDIAEVILGKIEALEIGNTRVQRYFSRDIFKDKFEMDSTHNADFTIDLTDAVQDKVRIQLTLKTQPFRTTASSVVPDSELTESSETDVQIASMLIPSADVDTGFYWRTFLFTDGTSTYNLRLQVQNASDNVIFKGNDPGHTHVIPDITLNYGIVDDTTYPANVTIYVNGADRTEDITGSATLDAGGAGIDTTWDITDVVNLAQENTISIRCASGQGLARIEVEEYLIIQAIKVS